MVKLLNNTRVELWIFITLLNIKKQTLISKVITTKTKRNTNTHTHSDTHLLKTRAKIFGFLLQLSIFKHKLFSDFFFLLLLFVFLLFFVIFFWHFHLCSIPLATIPLATFLVPPPWQTLNLFLMRWLMLLLLFIVYTSHIYIYLCTYMEAGININIYVKV